MRAAVLEEYGEPLVIQTVPDPEPGPEEAVVAVEACGICRSDWHAWQGHGEWANDQVPRGQILGHEPAGEVVAVGDAVETISVGQQVVVPFSLGDGHCQYCQTGHGNVCANGTALGFEKDAPGAFAEYVAVPAADYNLTPLPSFLAPNEAAALGCRYMTAYHGLANRTTVAGGDWLAVYGCGGVGLAAVQIGTALGARPIAVDPDPDARARATAVGAVETIDPEATDPVAAIETLTDGGADITMDALGIEATARNAVQSLRPRGTHLQVGLTTDAERGQVSLPTDWMTRWEIEFIGVRGMPPTAYEDLFALIEASDIDPGALIGREVRLEELSDRLAAMGDYDTDGIEVLTEF